MMIYCCGCLSDISARLTSGREIYPRRKDLSSLPFWRCDTCKNFVGCHHKTKDRTRPLGVIPTPAVKAARQHIHRVLDPLWESGRFRRRALYARIAQEIGIPEYHTAEIKSVEEARQVYRVVLAIGASS